jgi:hypothetical protein
MLAGLIAARYDQLTIGSQPWTFPTARAYLWWSHVRYGPGAPKDGTFAHDTFVSGLAMRSLPIHKRPTEATAFNGRIVIESEVQISA